MKPWNRIKPSGVKLYKFRRMCDQFPHLPISIHRFHTYSSPNHIFLPISFKIYKNQIVFIWPKRKVNRFKLWPCDNSEHSHLHPSRCQIWDPTDLRKTLHGKSIPSMEVHIVPPPPSNMANTTLLPCSVRAIVAAVLFVSLERPSSWHLCFMPFLVEIPQHRW